MLMAQPQNISIQNIVSVVACLGLIILVFELVRRKQIKEKYSFLWFVTGFSLLALSLKRSWLENLSAAIGIFYPPTALFLVLVFFVIVILVHFSMVLSKLQTHNQKLAQKIALLETEVESVKIKISDDQTA